MSSSRKTVCVVGAGAAGLCAIKNSIDFGLEVTAFEQSDAIGGTWVYNRDIGTDKHGLQIHSSMYKGLVTNVPKEIMGFIDLPFADQHYSYVTSTDVLNYLQWYATKFDLFKHIHFEHNVLRVRPLANGGWEVVVIQLTNNECKFLQFDVVMVCHGHNSVPNIPKFTGYETFGGKQLHAHDFRDANDFRGERVCIVGAGPSGKELVTLISAVAEHVTWSNHLERPSTPRFNGSVQQKPDVQSISETSVTFVDGSSHDFTTILYATGYLYTFPFLSIDSGLSTANNFVGPLYKYCISVNHPSLVFIGLLNLIGQNLTFDLQTKFALKYLTNQLVLPSREKMLSESEVNEFKDVGPPFPENIHTHFKYYNALITEAGLDLIKPVIFKICERAMQNFAQNASSYRSVRYKIIDNDDYHEDVA